VFVVFGVKLNFEMLPLVYF